MQFLQQTANTLVQGQRFPERLASFRFSETNQKGSPQRRELIVGLSSNPLALGISFQDAQALLGKSLMAQQRGEGRGREGRGREGRGREGRGREGRGREGRGGPPQGELAITFSLFFFFFFFFFKKKQQNAALPSAGTFSEIPTTSPGLPPALPAAPRSKSRTWHGRQAVEAARARVRRSF